MITKKLQSRRALGIERQLVEKKPLVDLTSNDYFGFASSLKKEDLLLLGGATGSRLLTGNLSCHTLLESELAHFHRAESALLFTSGYTANLGLISALGSHRSFFIYDEECHASTRDGITLSKSKSLPFRHNDLESLEAAIKQATGDVYVLVESLYSISGDVCPLQELVHCCKAYGAHLIVDEAHATGIFGINGEGLVSALQLEKELFARVCTCSKAIGAHGAFVLSKRELQEYLINFSRPFIYTTAMPELLVHYIRLGLTKLLQEASFHQHKIALLASYFATLFGTKKREGPIHPIVLGSVEKVKQASKKLQEFGLDVRPVLFPTTSKGKESLRVVLHSFNTTEHLDLLARVLL
jgi:8-amino-7-oxononanoate synthase